MSAKLINLHCVSFIIYKDRIGIGMQDRNNYLDSNYEGEVAGDDEDEANRAVMMIEVKIYNIAIILIFLM